MKVLKGIPGAPGIASGPIFYLKREAKKSTPITIDETIVRAQASVKAMQEKTLKTLGEEQAKIFAAYGMLLEDAMLMEPIKEDIAAGTEPETAIIKVCESMAAILSAKENEYLRQRADDIRYIGKLLLEVFRGEDGDIVFPDGEEKYILAADELTPVDTMRFDHRRLAGLVTEYGGAASHTVILAKSIGIPAVVGVKDLKSAVGKGDAYLDGYRGELVTEPDAKTAQKYQTLLLEEAALVKRLEEIKKADAYTKDGSRIAVCINIGKPADLSGSKEQKFDGVGLYRSEFLYSSYQTMPKIEEQTEAYRTVIDAVAPNPVTIRTLDVGGDKPLPYLPCDAEENPFLGCRGIRLCLKNPDVFMAQLEAILRAGVGKQVKIMLPMVSSLDEIRSAGELLRRTKERLRQQNADYCKQVSLGIMIETPAAALMARQFAKQCDFFSIGTNDLVQYVMAADRGNAAVSALYQPCHPAVLRLIFDVIAAGTDAGIEVSVCGDLAANTDFTEILLGMGLKKFSVPLPMVSRMKYKISGIDLADAKKFAMDVLAAEDEHAVQKMIAKRRETV